MTRAPLTILDAINDPALFRLWFSDVKSWRAWFAFLAALFALPLSTEQLVTYRQCTGRTDPPTAVAKEAWLICGRRAGKSFMLALIAVFLATFFDYRRYLQPGERGTIIILAADKKQARTILRYIRGLLNNVPLLKRMIEREVSDGFDLDNSVSIEIGTSNFRSTRGYTIVAALCDEVAFWQVSEDGSNPDFEVLAALRPAMATVPRAMLLVASSPYARRGALHDAYRKHFAKNGDPVLVWQAATRTMNPSVAQSIIDAAMERDECSARAEFMAEFRSDVSSYVSREAVEAVVSPSIFERPYIPAIKYCGFLDAAGGSGSDSMTMAIAHREGDIAILDAIREVRPPFSPEAVTKDFAEVFRQYNVSRVIADRFAGAWPVEAFSKHSVRVEHSAKPKSDIYSAFLPMLNSRKIDLLDHAKLTQQLLSLERRTTRGTGRDQIDHPPSGHDDIINAAAGALTTLSTSKYRYDSSMNWVGTLDVNDIAFRQHIFRGGF